MKFIMIIVLSGYYGATLQTQEFDSEATCKDAGKVAEALYTQMSKRVASSVCVPK